MQQNEYIFYILSRFFLDHYNVLEMHNNVFTHNKENMHAYLTFFSLKVLFKFK
jgi:hypothetical protein